MTMAMTPVPLDLLEKVAQEAPQPVSRNVQKANLNHGTSTDFSSRLLVEPWLTDSGRAFHVKPTPDAKGRTVYVLEMCPFNSEHGEDSCVMQASNGRMSARCFHNGCRGKGWQDFKNAIGKPKSHHYDPPLTSKPVRFAFSERPASAAKPNDAKKNARQPAPKGSIHDPRETPAGSQIEDSAEVSAEVSFEEDPSVDASTTTRRTIQGNRRQLHEVTSEALLAIVETNEPPEIFDRGGLLTRVRPENDNGTKLEPLTDSALRGVLSRRANWYQVRDTRTGSVLEDDAPPMEVVKDLESLPTWEGVPRLKGVVESPVFVEDGRLLSTTGYDAGSQWWYQPARGFGIAPVSRNPNECEIDHARQLLLTQLLGDFPFKDDASKAHAVGCLLVPFVRSMIDSPTPLHLFDAPTEGTGKTLLASCIGYIATGRHVDGITDGRDDAEWRKRITSTLLESPTCILLDNLTRKLDSGSLASVLTSRVWQDRALGFSKNVKLPNTALWMASGNNTVLSAELVRRTIWCRLDAKMDNPSSRGGFRHPQLYAWVREQRSALVHAVLTLIQAWIAAGRPPGDKTLGMFESWAKTIGGILQTANIPGLLSNAEELRSRRSDQLDEWREFYVAWWHAFKDSPVGVKELYELAAAKGMLTEVLGDRGDRSQKIRLGVALGKQVDRVVGNFRFERRDTDRNGCARFALQELTAETIQSAATFAEGVQQWEF